MSSPQHISPAPFRWHYAEFDDSHLQIRGRTLFFLVFLFSVILVVALLFIYARWVCLFGPPHQPPGSSSSSAHNPQPPPPRGLDLATINKMPIALYENSASASVNFSEAECCICLGIFGDKEKVKVLSHCRHCFHSECVDKWLTAHSSCPLCRDSLRVEVDSPV